MVLINHGTGTLRSITGDIRDNQDLTPEEIGLALLPASLFETLTDEEIGMFFLLYENASPFPVAGVSNETRIGSPVVSATVVAGEQTSFSNLREPVTIVVRLNPVQEGVSCTTKLPSAAGYDILSLLPLQNITRLTCVSWNFSLAGTISLPLH